MADRGGDELTEGRLLWLWAFVSDLLEAVENAMEDSSSMELVDGWKGLRDMVRLTRSITGLFRELRERERRELEVANERRRA